MKTIIAYGSLKKGLHNHRGVEKGTFLGETVVEGTMHSLGGYPVLMETKTEIPETEYTAEVYEITDEMYKPIHSMEIGAGYIAKEINTKYGNAIIFYGDQKVYTKARLKNYPKVSEWPPKQ